jgi:hypothetical protein
VAVTPTGDPARPAVATAGVRTEEYFVTRFRAVEMLCLSPAARRVEPPRRGEDCRFAGSARRRCLRSGVLALWRPRAGRELDLPARRAFAAAVAAKVWADVASAACVDG